MAESYSFHHSNGEITKDTEDHELLSQKTQDIKMKEAPFNRTESDEDILEDYDVFTFKSSCLRRRTCLEKLLGASLVVGIIIIIALAIALGKKMPPSGDVYCKTSDCVQAAGALLRTMDPTADPCNDFYQYACGGWVKETPIPPGYPLWDRFQELSYKNLYVLKSFIETHPLKGTAEAKARKFYDSCMTESKVKRQETIADFKHLLATITGPNTSSVEDIITRIHQHNVWPIFRVFVGPDENNPNRNIVKLDLGESPFPIDLFTDQDKDAGKSKSTMAGSQKQAPVNGTASAGFHTIVDDHNKTVISYRKEKPTLPSWNISEVVDKYNLETSRILRVVLDHPQADSMAEQLYELERAISKAQSSSSHMHNRESAYNKMTTIELSNECKVVLWKLYLKNLTGLDHGTDKVEVVVLHETALLQVCKIIEDYTNNATLRPVLDTFLKVSLVRSLKPYFDPRTFEEDVDPEEDVEEHGEHWRRCMFYTNKALGFATAAIYVNGTSQQGSINKIKSLVKFVKRAFKEYLLRKFWMDEETKRHAKEKIDNIIDKISYPAYILNTTFLDIHYKRFEVVDDWFENTIQWRKYDLLKVTSQLDTKPDRNSWINAPVNVESDYSPIRNDLHMPIAMFHLPFFSPKGSSALNFGAIGAVIGHEITHAFDIQGKQYDGNGRLKDWWKPVTARSFNVTTQCMREQYDKYIVDGFQVNGEKTLDENIADNGGLRAALTAYSLWLKEFEKEDPLPGVNLTDRQTFYVSFAQMFCSKWSSKGLLKHLIEDTHCPGPIRVRGVLFNTESFAEDFNCPLTATWNTRKRCEVW